MFSADMKHMIAARLQEILQETFHPELPEGEVSFILHVDGAYCDSWANIRNQGDRNKEVPEELICNLTV